MGLLSKVSRLGRFFGGSGGVDDPNVSITRMRICRFEQMEPRKLLAADLHLGAVYFEEASGDDSDGDTIEVTFNGGQPGTQLSRLVIDGDKLGDGLTIGDIFFDTTAGGPGSFGSYPFTIVSTQGFTITNVSIVDGGTKLVLDFEGFDSGEKLIFKVDVDEQGFLGSTSVTEGGEFEGTKLIGTFVNPHYETVTGSTIFYDDYDAQFASTTAASGKPLNLPKDSYTPPHTVDRSDRTAGGSVAMEQIAKPITIAGTVYSDPNLNNKRDAGETGIGNVTLTLLKWNGSSYVSTGKTVTTDSAGNYKFEGVEPGKYRIVETQPANFFSVGATAGSVDGETRGSVTSKDIISEIELLGGEDSIRNDFAEAAPVTIAGNVYHDRDNDGIRDAGEEGIGGVTIVVQPISSLGSNQSFQVITKADGSWSVTGLAPGTYKVYELAQPTGYLDGLDRAGSAGGNAINPGDEIGGVVLTGGMNATEYNFGELLPSVIRGRVHADKDGDCTFDPDESPIAGVTIQLLDHTGKVIATTKTDANGQYEFIGLKPGTYGVREIQPEGYFDGGDKVGTAGGERSANDTITSIVLVSGTQALEYNFCEHVPLSLSGYVYVDDNNNGKFDPGEKPLANVELELLDANGQPTGIKTKTDANGYYKFEGLDKGTYGVREVQPVGYYDGLDSAGTAGGIAQNPGDIITGAVLVYGKSGEQYNFGELRPTSISGRVHADPESDCVFGPNDIPLAGVKIHLLDQHGNIISTTFTNAQGIYKFENLAPGTYGVQEVQPAGYFDSGDHIGSAGGVKSANDTITQIVLGSGVNAVDYNFCEDLPVSLGGYVYEDDNNNGKFDPGERGIAGVTIALLDAQGRATGVTVKTDATGFYKFEGLAPGVYGVRETQPTGYLDGLDSAGSAGGVAQNPGDSILGANLEPTVHGVNYNFGELKPSSISGRIHADTNGNCEFDPGESPLEGVTVHLLDSTGKIIATTKTDKNGFYKFENLAPRTYGIREVQPTGYFDGGDKVGSEGGVNSVNDEITQIVMRPGVAAVNYNFCEKPPSSISGRVHADTNGNCEFDPGEKPIAGVKIELLDSNGNVIRTTFTDANGKYKFDDLPPGSYGIREIQPEGYFDGGDKVGSAGGKNSANDLLTEIILVGGTTAIDYNFCEKPPSSISGRVHADTNGNCTFDPGEKPIAGVKIELLDSNGNVIRTTFTDASGEYKFDDLPPGAYGVREVQPTGYFDGGDKVGSAGGENSANDIITQIVLVGGTTAIDYNFCEKPPASISGYVFKDGDTISYVQGTAPDFSGKNGRRTSDDAPIAGVVLQLGDEYGNPVLDDNGQPNYAVTNSQGYYEFIGLRAGAYSVRQVQPEGYIDSIDTAGTTGGIALNAGANLDPELASKLHSSVRGKNDAIVRITVNYGDSSRENNFSEVQVRETPPQYFPPDELPPEDPPVRPNPIGAAPPLRPFIAAAYYYQPLPNAYLGARAATGQTWHLSIVDAGFPRGESDEDGQQVAQLVSMSNERIEWSEVDLRRAQWTIISADGTVTSLAFGMKGAKPVVGDFNGDGISEVGVFHDGQWFIDINGNGVWDEGDLWAKLGTKDDQPVVGDWDGDGKDDIGIFGRAWAGDIRAIQKEPGIPNPNNVMLEKIKNLPPEPEDATHGKRAMQLTAEGRVREDLIDHVFHYGTSTDVAVVGDWTGDGIDTIAVFRDGKWKLDMNGDGRWGPEDKAVEFGQHGDQPIVGDWNGDGTDDLGVYRNGRVYLDNNRNRVLDATDQVFEIGGRAGDRAVVGDWNGDGIDEVAIYNDNVDESADDEALTSKPTAATY